MPLLFMACLSDGSVSSQTKEMNGNSAQGNKGNLIVKTNNATVEPTPVSKSDQLSKEARKTTQTFSTEELVKELPNLLGSYFFLIESYKPSYLIGDFNGDGYSDAAVVVGAQNKFGEAGETVNPYQNLCYLTVDVSFQNIITGGFVPARPQQSCREAENKKSVLQAKNSKYGLFVVFGDEQGLRNVSSRDDAFGRKFMLLDAVYENESIQKITADAKDSFAVKIKSCVPSNIKGDIIASINSDGGTLAIYFDGKKFNYKQCGD